MECMNNIDLAPKPFSSLCNISYSLLLSWRFHLSLLLSLSLGHKRRVLVVALTHPQLLVYFSLFFLYLLLELYYLQVMKKKKLPWTQRRLKIARHRFNLLEFGKVLFFWILCFISIQWHSHESNGYGCFQKFNAEHRVIFNSFNQ